MIASLSKKSVERYFFASDSIDDSRDPLSKAGLSIKGQLRSRVIKSRRISRGLDWSPYHECSGRGSVTELLSANRSLLSIII